jgi:RNA-directed DNA polymerase
MTATRRAEAVTPKLLRVMERAERDPEIRFTSLAHLIDEEALKRAYRRLRKNAAVGVDGITKEQYGKELESNVCSLRQRLKSLRYQHQPIRRVHLPKGRKGTRPIGIATSVSHCTSFSAP